MSDERVRELVRRASPPEEQAAQDRAWRVVEAAFERRAPSPTRRRIMRPALAAAVAVCAAAFALTPPGEAVGEWISDAVRPARAPSAPVLTSLPADGRLLVTANQAAWIVQADGSKRRLGHYDEAGWSPGGLFVVASRGRQLTALEPGGTVRWTVARPSPVSHPAWSPDGFRIAYLSGGAVRVVAGDGTGDARLAPGSSGVTPAWRPGAQHVLAHLDRSGQIVVTQTDTGDGLWRVRPHGSPRQLIWSADGQRLVAIAAGGVEVFDSGGRALGKIGVPNATRTGAAAIHPSEHALALIRYSPLDGYSKVVRVNLDAGAGSQRELFTGRGTFSDVAWSPDGGWVLVGWKDADQWLFIRGARVGQIRAVSNLGRQFDPGGAGPTAFPRVSGWCCS